MLGVPGLAWEHRADSWVFLVAQDGARHAFMSVPKRETRNRRDRKRNGEQAQPL